MKAERDKRVVKAIVEDGKDPDVVYDDEGLTVDRGNQILRQAGHSVRDFRTK